MTDLATLHKLLRDVEKPSQYLGNEVNAIHKDFSAQNLRVALVFPDAYEIGMSHMGLKILYDILNNIEGVVAERCFAPGKSFEKALRDNDMALYGLESKTPLNEFDVIAITLPYELTYTNLVNVIDLAGIPVWQKDRDENHPIVLAGGTGAYNPEPVADFLDAVAIGDGEEIILEFVSKMLDWKKRCGIDRIRDNARDGSRAELLDALKSIEGMYVPSFFAPTYNEDGTLAAMNPLKPDYTSVKKRVVTDLNTQPYPTKLVLPNIKLVHDRIGIEIQRGCTRMCRFCQAGYVDRPTRQRSPERVLEIADKSYQETGINEISLLSLSAGDYQTIVPTMKELNARYAGKNVAISVPATRTETLTPELIAEVKKVRKTGFTIAPEAGSERMRRVINKGNKTEDLMRACENAFSAGYRLIKFYYLCGIPFEHDEDLTGMADEADEALRIGLAHTRQAEINMSVSTLVPKPFTPFQWDPQITIEETKRRHALIKRHLKDKRVRFKYHEPEMSFLEGVFSRGDRRLSKAVYRAFENGCRFDEWQEHFDFAKWQKTFEETGVDPSFYLHRMRGQNEVMPWDHLFSQMLKEWLWEERENARIEAYQADCSIEKCAHFCGACDFKTVKNRIYVVDEKPLAAKKGNREWYGRFGESGSSSASELRSPATPNLEPHAEAPKEKFKLRVRFSKTGLAALVGHSELLNHLRRAILRTGAPVAYSEGFHPQMKISMGYALPLGMESECESFDLVVTKAVDLERFIERLNAALPQGISAQNVDYIDFKSPSLYSVTQAVRYRVQLPFTLMTGRAEVLKTNVERLHNGKDLIFVREHQDRNKPERSFDLSRLVEVSKTPSADDSVLEFTAACDPEGSIKPSEVVMALTGVTGGEINTLLVQKVGVHYREN
jgi:radical SAM family uncharacterized protein/radical SAM-linked protein